jgi:hypothetical protein
VGVSQKAKWWWHIGREGSRYEAIALGEFVLRLSRRIGVMRLLNSLGDGWDEGNKDDVFSRLFRFGHR